MLIAHHCQTNPLPSAKPPLSNFVHPCACRFCSRQAQGMQYRCTYVREACKCRVLEHVSDTKTLGLQSPVLAEWPLKGLQRVGSLITICLYSVLKLSTVKEMDNRPVGSFAYIRAARQVPNQIKTEAPYKQLSPSLTHSYPHFNHLCTHHRTSNSQTNTQDIKKYKTYTRTTPKPRLQKVTLVPGCACKSATTPRHSPL